MSPPGPPDPSRPVVCVDEAGKQPIGDVRPPRPVRRTDEQRADLGRRFAGPLALRRRNRAQISLRADAGEADAGTADEVGVSVGTAANGRRRFAAGGLDAALGEKPRSGGPAELDGKAEAVVIALACSPVPAGRVAWTARMPADRLVEMHVVTSVSDDTVLRAPKKATSSRGGRRAGACRRG